MITGNEPKERWYDNETLEMHGGLTIRQHFASMAMQGLLSQHLEIAGYKTEPAYKNKLINNDPDTDPDTENLAKDAVSIADALITELNKQT